MTPGQLVEVAAAVRLLSVAADQALAKVFALGTDADVAGVWIGGAQVSG